MHEEELVVDLTIDGPNGSDAGGCGLVNHPNGKMYSNSMAGLWELDATDGHLIGGPFSHAGNALGIAVDPQGSNHIVFVGDDCHPGLNYEATTCTFWDYDPATNMTAVFARIDRTPDTFVDGIYFDATGNFLFAAKREEAVGPTGLKTANHALQVIHRPAALQAPGVIVDDRPLVAVDNSQVAQNVGMTSEPDGVAFHAGDGFVVTLNESYDCQNPEGMLVGPNINPPEGEPISCFPGDTPAGGTMTRFDFGNGYANAPTAVSTFAAGGFRGDLLQVGADGCIYGTQGPQYMAGGANGTRYDNDVETTEQSIVRICGGFVTPPGVANGSVAGTVYKDANRDSLLNGGDTGLDGVTVTLVNTGTGATTTTTTASNGTYVFTGLAAATYQVSSPATANGLARETASPLTAVVASGEDVTDKNFGYVSGLISGFAYIDWNRDGVKDSGDTGLGGVSIDLVGGGTKITGPDGSYSFDDLDAGSYSVTAPGEADGKSRSTAGTLGATLAEGGEVPNLNFGYVPGGLSGFAYVDANRNGAKDSGEAGIGGVVITGPGGTTTTAPDGSYSFSGLDAGTYSVTAPSSASGKALFTASPLSVTIAAGATSANNNFGYVTGGLSGFAYVDANRNSVKDAGEAGIGGVVITGPSGTTTTAADGSYSFSSLDAGTYSVSAPSTASGKALFTASPLSVTIAAGATSANNNFGYVTGGLSGFAYVDANRNSVKDAGEAGIAGVTITGPGGTATTAADGSYSFSNLNAGTYSVSAPATASGKALFTASPLSVSVAAGGTSPNNNFGYVTGTISGFTYVDANVNGVRDSGEAAVSGVPVTLAGIGTVNSDANGFYSFASLSAATYSDSAPSTASGLTLVTPSPLSVVLAAGQTVTNVNFGYFSVVSPGDTGSVGYWKNQNGQALIKAVNGGPTATNFATWLATNFPYFYGINAGSNNLTGKTNNHVAALFVTIFNSKTDAQLMAVAIAAYVTSSTLAGGNYAAAYGFTVTPAGMGAKYFNVGSNGTAIGLSNNTYYTVMQLLAQANLRKQQGLYNGAAFNAAFNAVFSGCNQQGHI